jgi:alpha-beta hydrolase superfamily lysophospholipase
MEQFWFISDADGLEIAAYRWPIERPRAIVQIAHGMGEHALRYAQVATFLNRGGFEVVANDHRGHGRTAKAGALGNFGAGGWDALVADLAQLTRLAGGAHSGATPVVLLGHSMGSFAAQQYVLDRSAMIAGLVLSGSAALDLLPERDPSQPADLTAFNREFEPARTPFDWLSRDPAAVDAYVADPLCGFGIDARAMEGMSAARLRVIDPRNAEGIRKDLPIYILAGDKDPINHGLKWLRPLAARYRAAGIADVTEKYYPGGRHEMFNEINREEVLADLMAWLRRTVGA